MLCGRLLLKKGFAEPPKAPALSFSAPIIAQDSNGAGIASFEGGSIYRVLQRFAHFELRSYCAMVSSSINTIYNGKTHPASID
jgi:hypothetical protein